MRKLRFSEQEIVSILHEPGLGASVELVCRRAGIARQTYYRWRAKYAGLLPAEIQRIRILEDENVKLRRLVAYLSLDTSALRQVFRRKI